MAQQVEQRWSSRVGLILAMAGSAVGVGNFLRFPVQAVQNGGGAFIIPYIVSFVLLGIPLVLIEWSTGKYGGRYGRHDPPFILHAISRRPFWCYAGSLALFSSFVIASYYCFIESWILSYIIHSVLGTFVGMSETEISTFFDVYLNLSVPTLGIPGDSIFAFIICLLLNVVILSRGIERGIERVSKICLPLLFVFAIFLTYKAYAMKAGVDGAIYNSSVAFNFMWTINVDSLLNPKVWLAAASQVFFTLSLGIGIVQTYASYIKPTEDIATNSMAAAFTNEFAEIVLGSAIIVPIAIGYFGVDKVVELTQLGGFSLGFRSMPYLFQQWGEVLSILGGVAFFGLLFFAAITSSLSLLQPLVGFCSRNFKWSQKRASYVLGIGLAIAALPCVLFFDKGVFDQYDFWGGTCTLFLFAMIESILFSWVFGVNKGWKLIHDHADMRIPSIFKFVLKYITPTMFIVIFVAALIKPKNEDWSLLSFKGWELDNSSIIGELRHQNIGPNNTWFANEFYAENAGSVEQISQNSIQIAGKQYSLPLDAQVLVEQGQIVNIGEALYQADVINNVFYIDLGRIWLVAIFVFFCVLIWLVKNHTFEKK